MAIVTRRYAKEAPSISGTRLEGGVSPTASISGISATTIDIDIDDTTPGYDSNLDEFMSNFGYQFSPASEPISIVPFGQDAQTAENLGVFTTTSGVYVGVPGALTTPALTGTYIVVWQAICSNFGAPGYFRLRNVTDGVVLSGTASVLGTPAFETVPLCTGFAVVNFTGAPKTFEVQARARVAGGLQVVFNTRLAVWRLS